MLLKMGWLSPFHPAPRERKNTPNYQQPVATRVTDTSGVEAPHIVEENIANRTSPRVLWGLMTLKQEQIV